MTNTTSETNYPSAQQYVEEFHRTYGLSIRTEPTLDLPELEKQLRVDLILEEMDEYREAVATKDIVEMADALGDLIYVVYGAAITHGINLDPVVVDRHHLRMARYGIVPVGQAPVFSAQGLTAAFHRAARVPIRPLPVLDVPETRQQIDLLTGAINSYLKALEEGTVADLADAFAEIIHQAYSTALVHGIDLDPILAEIQRSNMSKLGEDGKPIYREDGKVLKGPNFFTPDIQAVLSVQTNLS